MGDGWATRVILETRRRAYAHPMSKIPAELRPRIKRELDALVAGDRPELLTWVRDYGRSGATLIAQPDLIWDHPETDVIARRDGTVYGCAPLWTTDESPSDLSVEFEVTRDGVVQLTSVHVL